MMIAAFERTRLLQQREEGIVEEKYNDFFERYR